MFDKKDKTFSISGTELTSLDEWTEEHKRHCTRTPSYSYTFTPTGIGCAVEVRCHCGSKQNITDYGSW